MGTTDELINWINEELSRRGWTLREFSRRSGISHATISRVLSGLRNPGVDFCLGIARAFGISPVTVFRKAGILPTTDDDDEFYEEAVHQLRRMSIRDRYRFLRVMKAWADEAPGEGEGEGGVGE